ncbi:MAG TPA: hypothetical protein PKW60_11870 [Candidatus Hydrogenedentes bacterium]|nr:hypothetical protein [Candidatus Hydrogenedentota bacterium]
MTADAKAGATVMGSARHIDERHLGKTVAAFVDGHVETRPAQGLPGGGVLLNKIAFHSDRDGNYQIYVMNADGTGKTRLTNNTASDYIYQGGWR